MPEFRGSMVAIVTPMKGGVTTDAAIDWDRYAALLEFHIAEDRGDFRTLRLARRGARLCAVRGERVGATKQRFVA